MSDIFLSGINAFGDDPPRHIQSPSSLRYAMVGIDSGGKTVGVSVVVGAVVVVGVSVIGGGVQV
jgi:hypothetical protein